MYAYIKGLKIPYTLTRVPSRTTVSSHLEQLLPSLTPNSPVLLCAGTGAGKTSAILNVLVPYAQEHGQRICFVSSRCAINLQFKRRLAQILGETSILTDYSDEGLRKLETIGPVTILTYHALWARMNTKSNDLRDVNFLVFDEVHALVLDAAFVDFTGRLLEKIPGFFIKANRIYLSATPDPVLPQLVHSEASNRLSIYQWKSDYGAYRLNFYSNQDDLFTHFKALPEAEKCLIFVDSIKLGTIFQSRLPDSQLITAETRKRDPVRWNRLISDPVLPTQFTIATSTLDAGVSLLDPDLHHIVCCGLDFAALVQQAGRKRLKAGESIDLYLPSPTKQQLGLRLQRMLELRSNLELCESSPDEFIRRFLLGDEQSSLRGMCYQDTFLGAEIDRYGAVISATRPVHQFRANRLAFTYLDNQIQLFQTLLARNVERPFEPFICKQFGQKPPDDPHRWLDGRFDAANREKFWNFIKKNTGKIFSRKEEKELFSTEFKTLHTAAYGPRKGDRDDRSWGANIIKKVLKDHNQGYELDTKKGWQIIDLRQQSA